MPFEFDPVKSERNKAKHGIDFIEAQALWDDPHRVEVAARSTTESRSAVIGHIQDRLWVAFVTYRHDEETIRLISVRRARPDERRHYDAGGDLSGDA
jgi:uncharacterized DUF497 family protein